MSTFFVSFLCLALLTVVQKWQIFYCNHGHFSLKQESRIAINEKIYISSISTLRDLTLHSSVRDISLSVRPVTKGLETKGWGFYLMSYCTRSRVYILAQKSTFHKKILHVAGSSVAMQHCFSKLLFKSYFDPCRLILLQVSK